MRRALLSVAFALGVLTVCASGQDYYKAASGGTFTGGTVTTPILFADGTSGAPSIAFASEPTLGFWRVAAGNTQHQGSFSNSGTITTITSGLIGVNGSTYFQASGSGGVGRLNILHNGLAIGAQLKVDALPVTSACGAGSPTVIAGSTPFAGGVTVGTGAPATCTITFGGTAYPSAPHCSGAVETTTAANARAMGYSATTTVLTIVPATAWADSSVVNWTCISSK